MKTRTNFKIIPLRAAMTLIVALWVSASAWAQYVAIFADPYSGGMVQVGTKIELDPFSDGASFVVAEPGETIYFSYEPYSEYRFKGLRYTNLSSSDVTELPNNIYSFTMPEYPADEEFWVYVFVELEKIPVIVTGVDINATNFPDEHFRNWLLSQSFGTDAVITDAEMATITKLSPRACEIEDLTGIQFFTELTELDISNNIELHPEKNWNRIPSIDLSSNTKLRKIYTNNNLLSSLDLSPCPELRTLDCSDNLLEELDVTSNPLLSALSCDGNQLTELDFSQNPSLAVLSCQRNKLTKLVVTDNPMLEQLYCENNLLTSIDVTNHEKLMLFNCNNNQLTSLDLTGCTALFQLYYYNNKIDSEAMEAMVNSLPTPPNGGYMVVVDLDSDIEQNVITKDQVAMARGKRWSVESISGEDFARYDGIELKSYFLIGEFNNWDQENMEAFSESDGMFSLTQTLSGEFLVKDENGNWLGGATDYDHYTLTSSSPSVTLATEEQGKKNLHLEFPSTYTFTIEDGVLTVSGFPTSGYYITGDFNDWKPEQMTDNGDGSHTIRMTLEASDMFKFRDHNGNWYGGDTYGNSDTYEIHSEWCTDVPVTMGDAGSNFIINTAGTYTFILTQEQESLKLTVRGFSGMIGDVNGDGTITVTDVTLLVNYILNNSEDNFIIENADVNGDGEITVTDVMALVDIILNKIEN